MNARLTKNRIRTLTASAVVAGSVLLTPAVGSSASQPAQAPQRAVSTAAQDVVDAAALAAFARAHDLTGLSPASLAPMPRACRGLSLASAQDCSADAVVDAVGEQ